MPYLLSPSKSIPCAPSTDKLALASRAETLSLTNTCFLTLFSQEEEEEEGLEEEEEEGGAHEEANIADSLAMLSSVVEVACLVSL